MIGISVVICTYNGARILPETICHIATQQVRQDINWEVVVVDNASTDETSQLAQTEWEKYKGITKFTIHHQPKQGLTYARELAIREATFEFILFCDDDVWLSADYLNIAYDTMLANTNIGVLGGKGELVFENDPPIWAINHKFFGSGPQAPATGKVKNNIVYGAGCIVRKSAFDTLISAEFSPMLTDRKANLLSSGGDYELCYAIALAGYDIWYNENLVFKHYMPKERLTWQYHARFSRESSQCFEVTVPYRFIVNLGCKSTSGFYYLAAKTILSYMRKMLPIYVEKLKTYGDSEKAKMLSLQVMALESKILVFKNHRTMISNFIKIQNLKLYLDKVSSTRLPLKNGASYLKLYLDKVSPTRLPLKNGASYLKQKFIYLRRT